MQLRNRQIPSVYYLLPLLLGERNSPLGVITALRGHTEWSLKLLGHTGIVARLLDILVEIIAIWCVAIIRIWLREALRLLSCWFPKHLLKIRDYLILGCLRCLYVVILRRVESWAVQYLVLPRCMIKIFRVHRINRWDIFLIFIACTDYHHRLCICCNFRFIGTYYFIK